METIGSPALWAGFIAFVLVMLALDLGIFHRTAHVVGFREALGWTLAWVALALSFGGFVFVSFGAARGTEFFSGYLLEKSLSIDNIFVFVLIFSALRIPLAYQHRVLFWGILSALVLRAAMIFGGVALLARFHWLIYVFGGFLVFTGLRLLFSGEEQENPEDGFVLRTAKQLLPHTSRLDSDRFLVKEGARTLVTPMFMALLLVEITDVVFALDSIPAIFAVTRDPFIVFTSNIFAILGLRSLFFVLADAVQRFSYLKLGLSTVLVLVGTKMCLAELYPIDPAVSLGVIALVLGTAIVASLVRGRGQGGEPGGNVLRERAE